MVIKISVPNKFKLKKVTALRTVLWPNQGELSLIHIYAADEL